MVEVGFRSKNAFKTLSKQILPKIYVLIPINYKLRHLFDSRPSTIYGRKSPNDFGAFYFLKINGWLHPYLRKQSAWKMLKLP